MEPYPITVAVNAGGKSSRMGQDKSFVPFQGKPMIEVVLARVAGLGQETMLITNNPAAYAHLGLPTHTDLYPEHGPLAGIFTAVTHAQYPHTLMVACDMPWLNRELLCAMIEMRTAADVIVPRWTKFPEPLHAIYSKACLPAMAAKLAQRQLKITGFFDQVSVHYVERADIARYDENGRSFANVNTPEELTQSQK